MVAFVAVSSELKAGQTPLDADEASGLLPAHISTQGELDEWEAENIHNAQQWLLRQKTVDVLSDHFCRELHKRMFCDTWKWAGTFRKTGKNIGCEWTQIGVQLRQLMGNVNYWLEQGVFPLDEVATRFHHQLVWIHPFANGNGRHARLMADVLLRQNQGQDFSWGSSVNLVPANETRKRYIDALRAADAGDYQPLLIFVRS
jgi:Fic-DOC domain mobile mystery protein B